MRGEGLTVCPCSELSPDRRSFYASASMSTLCHDEDTVSSESFSFSLSLGLYINLLIEYIIPFDCLFFRQWAVTGHSNHRGFLKAFFDFAQAKNAP